MKIIDCSAAEEEARQSRSLDEWLSSLKIGRSTSQDLEAQESVVAAFQRLIDNKFTLLRNVSLEELEMPVPMVLVGPTGLWVIYPSGLRGVYRAKGDAWEKIDERQQAYAPTGENLLTRTSVMFRAVESRLVAGGIQTPQLDGVVVFTNPGIHVEMVRPVVRIVLVDALERFITGVVQGRLIYDPETVQKIVDVFSSPEPGLPEQATAVDSEGGPLGVSGAQPRRGPVAAGSESLERIDNAFSRLDKLPFSSRQWVILGILILVNIVILIGFVIYILFAT